jgi:hypothetical protein
LGRLHRYRYVIKTRKQGRDAELVWNCAQKDCPGPAHTRDNVIPRFNRDHNHPPARADIDAKKFLVTVGERACKTLDPLPNLYDSEIIKFRNREWDDLHTITYQHLFEMMKTTAPNNNTPLNPNNVILYI